VFALAYARLWSYLTDDVFISVRYAANLMSGRGLVYNAGERVEGYTNFLWTLLLAPGIRLGVVPWVKVMNGLWALAAAACAWRLTRALAGRDAEGRLPAWTVVPAALTLASSTFVLSAAEGLETMMFAALLTLVAWWTWEARDDERLPRAALALVALGLTRPDGWAYLPWVALVGRARGRSWAWVGRVTLVAAVGLAAHEAFRLIYYGDLIPNTLHAKGGGTLYLLDRGWTQLLEFLRDTGGVAWLLVLVPLLWRETRPGAVALLSAIAIRVAFQLWSGGPWMARGRFLTPVLPLAMILMCWGGARALRGAQRAAALAVLAALVLTPGWLRHRGSEASALHYGAALRAAHQRLGADIAAHTTPDAVMAMDDAGIGPLIAGRTSIDMLGLNDRHLGRLPGDFGVKFDAQYLLDRNPDLVVLMSRRPPPITSGDLFVAGQVALFEDPLFQERYRFAREYEFEPTYRLLLYRRVDSKKVFGGL
jgi:hypothetical protein